MLVMAEKMNESAVLRMPILFSLVNPSTKGSILPTISPHCCSVCITRCASGASGQRAKAGVFFAAGYHLSSNLRNHVGYPALQKDELITRRRFWLVFNIKHSFKYSICNQPNLMNPLI